ncbi:family 1 glycosylhydrolase (plasmid) [Croceibacterium sp. TMG7-5b_MA50]|uniref:family 1 glycosylhydrolase n=1 Tax=Croceibacterium sp. TMG7-5b_MA50 TaxID=3121290 RepID=UPI003221B977
MIDRRTLLAAGAAGALAAAAPAFAQGRRQSFPQGFLWGAATAGHQVEGNNVAADLWLLENMQPTIFAEPSGDAVNHFGLWAQDLDMVKAMGLNTYRFSLEWARIEPEPGLFSTAMLDHYKAVIDGCRDRGLNPVVTFQHFTAPRWFSAQGGWTNREAPALFARYCSRAAEHLGENISHALTMNEPQILRLLRALEVMPEGALMGQRAMLEAAAKRMGTDKFVTANVANFDDLDTMQALMIEGHGAAKAAIKAVRGDLPVGVSLALIDNQARGPNSVAGEKAEDMAGAWLRTARGDDFLGVQNYERIVWDAKGKVAPPADAVRNWGGSEVHAPSLAGAVRQAHAMAGVPILVSEHGVGTDDDAIRARFIPEALAGLSGAMADGIPVLGYIHWSLMDNFEWIFGYKPRFGLVSVDRTTFARTPKPSAEVLGRIARANSL